MNGFTDHHDNIQTKARIITWFNEFAPSGESSEEGIADVLLWAFHLMGLFCTFAGEHAMHRGGKLASSPDSIAIYIASHPQKRSSNIAVLLQKKPNPTFSMASLEILCVPEWNIPGKMWHYVIRYGVDIMAPRIICIDSVNPCGPRYNKDLPYYISSNYNYYCTSYAIVMVPSNT